MQPFTHMQPHTLKLFFSFLALTIAVLIFTESAFAQDVNQQSPDWRSDASAYVEHELGFRNGQIELAGSLLTPPGEGPFPAVVMIHGSAADTRDVFQRTGDARAFLDAGFAVYIYDKRGTGNSGGDWRTASLEDLADDAIAAVRMVKQQPGVGPLVGVFGVSQGGWLGPLAASRSPEVDFVINVTGAAVPLANQEMWSIGNELQKRGFSPQALTTTMKAMHMVYSARPLLQTLPLGDLHLWFTSLDPYLDPADFWAEVTQPAFVAYGGTDSLVPTDDSVAVLEEIWAAHGNPNNRLFWYPQAGHGVRLPSGEWAPGHIKAMTGWLMAISQNETPPQTTNPGLASPVAGKRWHTLSAAPTSFYASAAMQLPLMLVFLVAFLMGFGLSLFPRANLKLDGYALHPRLFLFSSSLLNLLLFGGLFGVIAYLAFADANNSGPDIPFSAALSVLSLVSLALSAGLAYIAWKAYREQIWSRVVRTLFIISALATLAFLTTLAYWGPLGLPL
ncbi:MAG: alpha/beta fold hydrolase [Caldilineales bacterium]|nr:alpha/beta fold hydrolase [Caldilineales bacterium]